MEFQAIRLVLKLSEKQFFVELSCVKKITASQCCTLGLEWQFHSCFIVNGKILFTYLLLYTPCRN